MTHTNSESNLETVYAARKIEESWLASDPEAVHTWARSLKERFEGAKVAVGVELSKGALIEELRSYDFIDIYPLNPATTCAPSTSPAGNHNNTGPARFFTPSFLPLPSISRLRPPMNPPLELEIKVHQSRGSSAIWKRWSAFEQATYRLVN